MAKRYKITLVEQNVSDSFPLVFAAEFEAKEVDDVVANMKEALTKHDEQ